MTESTTEYIESHTTSPYYLYALLRGSVGILCVLSSEISYDKKLLSIIIKIEDS